VPNIFIAGGDATLQRYFEEISGEEPLPSEKERELCRLIREGDKAARDRLIRANLRFVVTVAKGYQNQGMPLADLINEGNMGLIRAVEKFDWERGYKFISYAVWWIRQGILQALAEQSRIVRMPVNRIALLAKISKVSSLLEQEIADSPDVEAIAEELGDGVSPDQVEDVLILGRNVRSLDAEFGDEKDGRNLLDVVESEEPPTDEETIVKSLREDIEEVLAGLTEREAEVIRLYFGLGGREPLKLEEIGGLYGITRERVRQIKDGAMKRLRHPKRARALQPYLDD